MMYGDIAAGSQWFFRDGIEKRTISMYIATWAQHNES